MFGVWSTLGCTQVLDSVLRDLSWEQLGEPNGMPEIKSGPFTCKTNVLTTVLSKEEIF